MFSTPQDFEVLSSRRELVEKICEDFKHGTELGLQIVCANGEIIHAHQRLEALLVKNFPEAVAKPNNLKNSLDFSNHSKESISLLLKVIYYEGVDSENACLNDRVKVIQLLNSAASSCPWHRLMMRDQASLISERLSSMNKMERAEIAIALFRCKAHLEPDFIPKCLAGLSQNEFCSSALQLANSQLLIASLVSRGESTSECCRKEELTECSKLIVQAYMANQNVQMSKADSAKICVKLLKHSIHCHHQQCPDAGCKKMKKVIIHFKACRSSQSKTSCSTCKKFIALCCLAKKNINQLRQASKCKP